MMTALVVVVGYLAAVLACTALLIRLRPRWVLKEASANDVDLLTLMTPAERSEWDKEVQLIYGPAPKNETPEKAYWRSYVRALGRKTSKQHQIIDALRGRWEPPFEGLADHGLFTCAFSPFLATLVLPVSMVIEATTRSLNAKTRTRVELEKELAAARKEVDELLGRTPAPGGA